MSDTPSVPQIQARLRELARKLRQSSSVDAETQSALAELMDELSAALGGATVPPAEVAHLADSTAHLADALHHQHDRGVLESARDRLQEAVIRAEAESPVAVGLARRLLDALANLGI